MIDDLTPHLDPELAAIFAETPRLDLSFANISTTRKASRTFVQQLRDLMPELPNVGIEDRKIPGPEGAPPVPVRILRPTKPAASNGTVLVWIHGGGFLSGHHEDVDPRVSSGTVADSSVTDNGVKHGDFSRDFRSGGQSWIRLLTS